MLSTNAVMWIVEILVIPVVQRDMSAPLSDQYVSTGTLCIKVATINAVIHHRILRPLMVAPFACKKRSMSKCDTLNSAPLSMR